MNNNVYTVVAKKTDAPEPTISQERLKEIEKSVGKYIKPTAITCPCCGKRLEIKPADDSCEISREEIKSVIDEFMTPPINELSDLLFNPPDWLLHKEKFNSEGQK